MNRFFPLILFFLFTNSVVAQRLDRNALGSKVVPFVHAIGSMKDYHLKDIVDTFKSQRLDEIEMTYAIYTWIGRNITYDCNAYHHPNQANHTASNALNKRRASHEGYGALFQTMCDLARIQCVTISGFAKAYPENIGKLEKRSRHTWNAVKIKNTWYNIDVAWGAGTTDIRKKDFTRSFTDAWFFTDSDLFLLSHFPDDKKWQLTDEPVTKVSFTQAPVIASAAIVFGLYPPDGIRGKVRGREKVCKPIVFEMLQPERILKVDMNIDGEMLPAEYTKYESKLLIEMPFPYSGTYPITIYINNKPAFGFIAEVSKKRT